MHIKGQKGTSLAKITDNSEYHFEQLARLPHDEESWTSTAFQSKSPIETINELTFTIHYTTIDGRDKAAMINREINLASCMAFDTDLL